MLTDFLFFLPNSFPGFQFCFGWPEISSRQFLFWKASRGGVWDSDKKLLCVLQEGYHCWEYSWYYNATIFRYIVLSGDEESVASFFCSLLKAFEYSFSIML